MALLVLHNIQDKLFVQKKSSSATAAGMCALYIITMNNKWIHSYNVIYYKCAVLFLTCSVVISYIHLDLRGNTVFW